MTERVIRLTRHFDVGSFTVEWEGGEYADIAFAHKPDVPFDVLNMWDNENDERRVPFTRSALNRELREWAEALSLTDVANFRESLGL